MTRMDEPAAPRDCRHDPSVQEEKNMTVLLQENHFLSDRICLLTKRIEVNAAGESVHINIVSVFAC